MKILLLLISLIVLADCKALISKEDAPPRCIKIDECSCRLKNVQEPGLINLHDLVSDNEPRFVTEGKSEQTGLVYTFYYNPCKNFLDLVCPNTSICQKDQYEFYDLGNLNTAEFEYQNNSVIVVYKSLQNYDGINRTSEVELICMKLKFREDLSMLENQSKHTTSSSSTLSVHVLVNVRYLR